MEEKKIKEQKNNKKKNKAIKAVALLGLFLMVFGISYALFSVVLNGTKRNRITTARLSLKLTDEYGHEESEGYGINLESVVPMTDEEGLETTSYKFVVENDGTIPASYKLILEDAIENTLQDKYIKYNLVEKMYLKKSDGSNYHGGLYNTEPRKLDTLTNRELHEITILPGQKIEYTLNLWLDEDADNGAMDKEFESVIKIDGVQATTSVKGKAGENIDYTLYNDGTLIYTGSGDMNGIVIDNETGDMVMNNNGTALIDIVLQKLKKENMDINLGDLTTEEGQNNLFYFFELSGYITGDEVVKQCVNSSAAECYVKREIIENIFNKDASKFDEMINYLDEIPQIKEVIVDEGITSISSLAFPFIGEHMITLPSTIKTFGAGSFESYQGYTVIIPASLTTIPADFAKNSNIKEITIPGTVKTIEERAFAEIPLLKKITIEEGVERIESRAFASTTASMLVRSAQIPNSVKYVGNQVFQYWQNYGSIEVDNTKAFVDANWDSYWEGGANVTYLR